MTDTRPPSRRRPSWPFLITPRRLTVSGRKTCLSEQLTKTSQLHLRSGHLKMFPEVKLALTGPPPTVETCLQTIRLLAGQLTAYTDGSATASTISDPPRPTSYASARSLIRRTRILIHPRQICGQRRCMAGSSGPRVAWPLATERMWSSLRACEPTTPHCWKPSPISLTPSADPP